MSVPAAESHPTAFPPALLALIQQQSAWARGDCPWCAAQDSRSLLPCLEEESRELAEAIRSGDKQEIVDELGDVLYQVLFHSDLASRNPEPEQAFNLEDVAAACLRKMRRRHGGDRPGTAPKTLEEAKRLWVRAKAQEIKQVKAQEKEV